MNPNQENRETGPTSRPEILDVVKLDGRWAQIRSGGGVVNYLDDNSSVQVNWDDYQLSRNFKNLSVKSVIQIHGEEFTENEIKNIHWGPEQTEDPKLRLEVKVFGEYVKK